MSAIPVPHGGSGTIEQLNGPAWDDVSAFRAVAEELSFTRAASRLFVTQSALSQRVRRLEVRLGLRLLDRTTRSVAPTGPGRLLLDWAVRVEQSWAHTVGMLDTGPGPSAVRGLRLGLLPVDPAGTVRYLQAHLSRTTITMTVDSDARPLLAMVRAGELDAVCTTDLRGAAPTGARDVHVTTIVNEPVWVLLGDGHRLAARAAVTLADLRDDVWIIGPPSSPLTRWEQEVLGSHGVTRTRSVHESPGRDDEIDSGAAVRFAGPLHRSDGARSVRPLLDPVLTAHQYLAWNPRNVGLAQAEALVAGLRGYYRTAVLEVPAYRAWIDERRALFPGIASDYV